MGIEGTRKSDAINRTVKLISEKISFFNSANNENNQFIYNKAQLDILKLFKKNLSPPYYKGALDAFKFIESIIQK